MYQEILDHIFKAYPMYHRIGTAAYKEGFENIHALLDLLDHPERKFKSIHIAGTNGKGSVAHLMASYCQEQHLKTGLFTSPHLVDFRERIRLNGEMITEREVVAFFQQHQQEFDLLQPSFFEVTTALAFDYFAKQQVDIAIIEVGLGGRLDCTNVIQPLLSIITNITLEHTRMLGDTIAKIAFEKAGIIKANTPVVIGEFHPESYPVFSDIAHQRQAPLFLACENYTITGPLTDCTLYDVRGHIRYEHLHLPLMGEYQRKNLQTFLQAADLLQELLPYDKDVVPEAIEHLLANTGFQGRWQILRQQPLTLCDVGHNVGGLSLTMPQLTTLPHRHLRMVFGMVQDKDIEHILPLLPQAATYYLCQAAIERAIPAQELAHILAQHDLHGQAFSSVAEAFHQAEADADPDDVIFIGGSCFIVGDLLSTLQIPQTAH